MFNRRTGRLTHGAVQRTGRTELTAIDQQEAAGAHEFVGLLGRDTLGDIRWSSRFRGDFLILLFFVVSCCDAILQDRIEVGFDVVGVEVLLLVVIVLALRAGRESCVSLSLGIFIVLEHDIVGQNFVEILDITLEVLSLEIDLKFFHVEFFVDGIVSHGVLGLGPPSMGPG